MKHINNFVSLESIGFCDFFVSKEGLLFKKAKHKLRQVKLFKDKNGYFVTKIQENKRRISIKIHRLVALCFMSGFESGVEINHIDGNKENNNLKNLSLCSRKENMSHAFLTGLINNAGERNGRAKLKSTDVVKIKKMKILGETNREIAKKYNVAVNTISRITSEKTYQVKIK